MESAPPKSVQAVLGTVMKLHGFGCSAEEIACRLLSGGEDTIAFRVQGLVEIAIAYAGNRKLEIEGMRGGETLRSQGD
ncbi:MAG: hypothetical protein HZA60_04335 [Deltaproteobacteria bacterium]|nr:hypothetical protein [Deltaproteobacteria bacterium]